MNEDKKGGQRLFFMTGLLVLISLAAYLLFGVYNAPPHPYIPTPKEPNQNARKVFTDATKLFKDSYKLKIAAYKNQGAVSLAEKKTLVAENAPALAKFREGFKYEYADIPERSLDTSYPHLPEFRKLGRLVSYEGQVKAAGGDWSGAMSSYLDGIQLGETLPSQSSFMGMLVGGSIDKMNIPPAWDVIDHLDAKRTQQAITRLQAINCRRVPFWKTLKEEEWGMISSAVEYSKLKSTTNDSVLSPWGKLPNYKKRRVLRECEKHYDRIISVVKGRYGNRPPDLKAPQNELFNGYFYPDYRLEWFLSTKIRTQNELLLVALALHAYKLDHGGYPKSVSELVPQYLKCLPEDEFAKTGTFCYKLTGKSFVLYSIGPDGKDDGGNPICDHLRQGNDRYVVLESNKGDIVAGVNK